MAAVNVLAMSSGDDRPRVPDFAQLVGKGIMATIHRASEGTQFVDALYIDRRQAALAAGMLWGAWHTIDAGDPIAQADRFLQAVGAQDQTVDMKSTLLAVEYVELGTPAALHQLYTFCGYIDRNAPFGNIVINGGSYLRSTLPSPDDANVAVSRGLAGISSFMRQRRLWCNENSGGNPPPKPPYPWDAYYLRRLVPTFPDPIVGAEGTNTYAGDHASLVNTWVS